MVVIADESMSVSQFLGMYPGYHQKSTTMMLSPPLKTKTHTTHCPSLMGAFFIWSSASAARVLFFFFLLSVDLTSEVGRGSSALYRKDGALVFPLMGSGLSLSESEVPGIFASTV